MFDFSVQTAIASTIGISLVVTATMLQLRLATGRREYGFWTLAYVFYTLRQVSQFLLATGMIAFQAAPDILVALYFGFIWCGVRTFLGKNRHPVDVMAAVGVVSDLVDLRPSRPHVVPGRDHSTLYGRHDGHGASGP